MFVVASRYELPGIHGLNFILPNALGGGGVASLRSDPQVKHIHSNKLAKWTQTQWLQQVWLFLKFYI